jgi:preprotein translocase subunit SecD
LLNQSNYNQTIISSNTDAARIAELEALGFEVVLKESSEMVPDYSIQEDNATISEWRAIGLLSAPILNPEITEGRINRFYSISGFAPTRLASDQKMEYAYSEVKTLKSVLSGGALPVHIIIGTPTTIPAPLGAEFLKYSLIAAVCAVLVMVLVISIRYMRLSIAPLILATAFSELVMLIGIIGSLGTIDLGAMAGIIGAIGTGVDAKIVITDEMFQSRGASAKKRLSHASYIILTNATIAVIAMIPLLFFSGLVEIIGFALSIIFGMFIGALITRPAYGAMIEFILNE